MLLILPYFNNGLGGRSRGITGAYATISNTHGNISYNLFNYLVFSFGIHFRAKGYLHVVTRTHTHVKACSPGNPGECGRITTSQSINLWHLVHQRKKYTSIL